MKNLIISLSILVVVIISFTSPHLMLNPGELTKGHQKIKDECTACHKPLRGINELRCIACHKIDEIGTDSYKLNPNADKNIIHLFHSKLKTNTCTSCHTDHKGLNAGVTLREFKHSFLADDEQANCQSCHKLQSNKLHQSVTNNCGACHTTTRWQVGAIFSHSQLIDTLQKSCIACHEKPKNQLHQAISSECNLCHSNTHWKPATFEHSAYFALDNNHNTSCNNCHTTSSYKQYTCYGCHEHSQGKIAEEHTEEGISNIANCISCHKSGNEHDIEGKEGQGGKLNEKEKDNVKEYIKSKESEGDDD